MTAMPALFVSHGAPTLILDDVPARAFLARVGGELGRPSAVVVVSAHYEATGAVRVDRSARPRTIHDFRGFPPALYEIEYPAPGDPALADEIVGLARAAGLAAETDEGWGLDHGAWVPLALMYPGADIPVVAVSVDPAAGPEHHRRLGAALAPLRARGVLVLASGSFTHNLYEIPRPFRQIDTPAPDWVGEFADWAAAAIVEGRPDDLLDYRRVAPHGARNHPTEEHLLPLFAAMGAGGMGEGGGVGRRLHDSTTFAVLRMDAYAFG
ncbi:class III extradiol ring-cleavage dioxygenase [Thalassobaculum sp.]|uniref:dioxygenase family protein n=1 Tax=Thalassobaculum sp. TaxID=2022740 RepID=UPI0032EBF0FF